MTGSEGSFAKEEPVTKMVLKVVEKTKGKGRAYGNNS